RRSSGLSPQSRRMVTFAILLFALSGLVSGFAVGAFVRPKIGGLNSNNNGAGNTPVAQQTKTTATAIASPENQTLGVPVINSNDYTYLEVANGTTTYSFSALIVDDIIKKPIQANDVTCKLWMTKDGRVTPYLEANHYAIPEDFANLTNPFSDEVQNALNFVSPSQQTQPCTSNSKTTWSYTISSSLERGVYYLVVLADWRGKHYNWATVAIIVKKN
ncbi:MAG TPA: hypothetical protein VKR83_08880, partial [Ktedonobacteraceae bacterium]|nr:hypothetical protein [Ktedonobacteraceae bacterium]